MKFINNIIIFTIDILKQKKNKYYINRDISYQFMRLLYRISNGLLTHLMSIFFSGFKIKSSNNFPDGFIELNKIEESKIEKLKRQITLMRVFDKTKIKNKLYTTNSEKLYTYKFDDLRKSNAIRIDVLKKDLLANAEIAKLATDRKWLNIANGILNVPSKLIDITCWYTLPPKNHVQDEDELINIYDAQIWHRDVDRLRDIKIFIYLSDVVNDEDGAFEIIKNTHKINTNIVNYHNKNNFRILNKDLPEKFQNKKKKFFGTLGTNFVVDTRCLHRGSIVKRNYRLVLELYFSDCFFGKHLNYNIFYKPKLEKSWESYKIWNEIISKYPENYKYIFIAKN